MGLIVLVVLVASAWSFHAGPVSALLAFAAGPSLSMDVEAEAAKAGSVAASSTLIPGTDYDFFSIVAGAPVAWSCSRVVTVRLAGSYPSSAPWALDRAVDSLSSASGLLLVVGDDATAVPSGGRPPEGEIIVTYTSAAHVHSLSDSADAAGVTSTQWNAHTGEILNALVLIDARRESVAPHTGKGFTMLLHELGHAVGLGHSLLGSDEVMDPVTAEGDRGILGAGDRYALGRIGCG